MRKRFFHKIKEYSVGTFYDLKRENIRQKEEFDKMGQNNNNFVKKYLYFVNKTA